MHVGCWQARCIHHYLRAHMCYNYFVRDQHGGLYSVVSSRGNVGSGCAEVSLLNICIMPFLSSAATSWLKTTSDLVSSYCGTVSAPPTLNSSFATSSATAAPQQQAALPAAAPAAVLPGLHSFTFGTFTGGFPVRPLAWTAPARP